MSIPDIRFIRSEDPQLSRCQIILDVQSDFMKIAENIVRRTSIDDIKEPLSSIQSLGNEGSENNSVLVFGFIDAA